MSQSIEMAPEKILLPPHRMEEATEERKKSIDEVDIYPTGKALLAGMDPYKREAVYAAMEEMRKRVDADNQVFH